MNISAPFIRRPIATSLLMAGILFVGVAAYPLLPVAPLPQVDFPTIQVTTQLPGADPITMASSVTAPLARQFAEIPGVSEMTSSSVLGTSSITVQFDSTAMSPPPPATCRRRSMQPPASCQKSSVCAKLPESKPGGFPILIFAVHSDSLPITTVDDYAENILLQSISQIPGVAQVNIGGQQKPAVRIQIHPQKLASMGIGLEDLRAAITNVTTDSPKGSIDGATAPSPSTTTINCLRHSPERRHCGYKNGAQCALATLAALSMRGTKQARGVVRQWASDNSCSPETARRQRDRHG